MAACPVLADLQSQPEFLRYAELPRRRMWTRTAELLNGGERRCTSLMALSSLGPKHLCRQDEVEKIDSRDRCPVMLVLELLR